MAKNKPDFSLDVKGLDSLARTVNLSLEWAKKPFSKKAALQIREAMHTTALEIAQSEGSKVGEKWPALAPSTQAYKAKRFPGRPMMVRTGDLINSFTNDKSPRNIFRHRGNQITWGSRSPYAKYHQLGGTKKGRPPKRVLFVMTKDLAADIGHTIAGDLLERVKG